VFRRPFAFVACDPRLLLTPEQSAGIISSSLTALSAGDQMTCHEPVAKRLAEPAFTFCSSSPCSDSWPFAPCAPC